MFNYHYELPERHIWANMGPELIPLINLPKKALQGRMAK